MNKKMLRFAIIGVIVALVMLGIANLFGNKYNLPSFDYDDVEMVQLQQPEDGQEIAIIDTSIGEFKVALYRDLTPNTVEHFVNLAESGYYDGKYFYKIESDMYFFAGTTNQNGYMVEESDGNYDEELYDIEHKKIKNEISKNLWPLKGSLIAMGPDHKDSGTFITGINTMEFDDELTEQLNTAKNANKAVTDAFIEKGGVPIIPHEYTVFAQTYEGMDVFEKIFEVEIDKDGAPKEELIINSITISTYGADDTQATE